jgi:two-component system, sensor histidine kinase
LGIPSLLSARTGLGLALSISLISQHGGTLKLQSELGRGTTATFDLRLLDMEAANDD